MGETRYASLGPAPKIAVLGLGYVGLPLAVALAAHYQVIGFDIDSERVNEVAAGFDRTGELDKDVLETCGVGYTSSESALRGSEIFIVTVPTPVDSTNRPDLGALHHTCEILGPLLKPGAIVVFESTVYPGVTEDICKPRLEKASGLVCGQDFFLGYAPERINPGDKMHTVGRASRVVAGQTPVVLEQLAEIYGSITSGQIFRAVNIKTAEAAKVIENAQRDINIAFINEAAMIFHKLGLSIYDVLDAANTKWNFLNFRPGLVGGHCIGVDPFYLAHCARNADHDAEVTLSGRRINDGMGQFVADEIAGNLDGGNRVLVLGLTFKENVSDLRNSKVVDVIRGLERHDLEVDVHDCCADASEAGRMYGLDLLPSLRGYNNYACVVGAVAHTEYKELGANRLLELLNPSGLVADIKGMWRDMTLPPDVRRWQL